MKSELSDQFMNHHAFINFAPNEEMSSDLQKKLKKINKLPDGLYETKFKIDRYKFDRALKNELSDANSLQNLFDDIMTDTNTTISLRMTCKSNSKLRNPLVSVVGSLEGIELAKEQILAIFENIKMRVVLKMDVSYKDHSHIIGRGGFSIQRVMDDTGSHIHFPDSNRISEVKKSNVVLVCGSPTGVEQARCKIRNLLPLVVHFKIPVGYLKTEYLRRGSSSKLVESYSKHFRPITQAYNVHISVRNSHDIDEGYAAIFDSSNTSEYIAVSVRGANNDLAKLKESLSALINRLADFSCTGPLDIDYVLTIEITEFYHQLVMGTNFLNIKNIMQQTRCVINFPEIEASQRPYDLENLNEIPVNKSTVIIKGKSFEAVHTAWKELIGYLPLVLTFDVAHEQPLDTVLINQLKKQYKVAIFLKHKEKFNTVIIRGIEKNSRALFEVRKQLLKLEDGEIPICCLDHNDPFSLNSKLFGQCIDENGNNMLTRNENTTGLINSLIGQNGFRNTSAANLNLLNSNAANILNTKMMHNLDSNNNLNDKNSFCNQLNLSTSEHLPYNIDSVVFQKLFQERILQLQVANQRGTSKQSSQQPFGNNSMFGHNSQSIAALSSMANDEVHKLYRQQQNLYDSSLRNTHSVSDIHSLQTNHQIFQNDGLHQALKKEHLTTSCSSPSLNAMVQNCSNLSLLNHHNNSGYSMNNSNLNSTGNNTSSSATASTANNSFNSNGLTSSPPTNSNSSSSFGSLAHNQSPMQFTPAKNNNCNWLDQRRQVPYDECRLLALKKTYEKPDSNEVRIPSSVWSGLGFSKSMSHDTVRTNRLAEWNPNFNSSSILSGINSNNNNHSIQNNVTGLSFDDVQKHSINKMNLGSTGTEDFVWPDVMQQNNNPTSTATKQRALIKQESEICSSSHPYSSSYLSSLMNNNDHNQHQFTNFSTGQYLPNQDHNSALSTSNQNSNECFDVNNIDLATVLSEYQLGKYVEIFRQFKIDFAQFLSLNEDDLGKLGIHFVGRRKVYTVILEMRKALLSNLIGTNFTKGSNDLKQVDDELSAAINKELKSFSSSIDSPSHDQSPSSTKDYNGNIAKKFGIFNNPVSSTSNGFGDVLKLDDSQKTMSRSVDEICDVFGDSMKLGKGEIGKHYTMQDDSPMMLNSSTDVTSTNEKFDLKLNVNGDAIDDKLATNYSTCEKNTKEADVQHDGEPSSNNVDEDRLTTDKQDLVTHGGSVQEVAQA